jgi:hypothetical protein
MNPRSSLWKRSLSNMCNSNKFGSSQLAIGSSNFWSHFGFSVFHIIFVENFLDDSVPFTNGSERPACSSHALLDCKQWHIKHLENQ